MNPRVLVLVIAIVLFMLFAAFAIFLKYEREGGAGTDARAGAPALSALASAPPPR